MPEELVTTALQRAFFAQPPTPSLIVHSDRGGQYCGNAYRALLPRHGAVRSQSRRGECYDNALPGTTQSPLARGRYVMSDTQTWLARVGLGWSSSRLEAQRSPWVESVVRGV